MAAVFKALSDEARWSAFDSTLNQHLLCVYDLQPERVRLNRTIATGY